MQRLPGVAGIALPDLMAVKRVAVRLVFTRPALGNAAGVECAPDLRCAAMPFEQAVSSTGLCCGAQVRIGCAMKDGLDVDVGRSCVSSEMSPSIAERAFGLDLARHRLALDRDLAIPESGSRCRDRAPRRSLAAQAAGMSISPISGTGSMTA